MTRELLWNLLLHNITVFNNSLSTFRPLVNLFWPNLKKKKKTIFFDVSLLQKINKYFLFFLSIRLAYKYQLLFFFFFFFDMSTQGYGEGGFELVTSAS
jgi:hypothetical protein